MTRQIKFRGKTTANGHWVYGSLIAYVDGTCAIRNSKSQPWVQPETVGQFTGRLDRNGKEVYEGDVVEIISYYTSPREKEMSRTRAVIMFDETLACFLGKRKSASFAMTCASNMEVVGNIHEESKS